MLVNQWKGCIGNTLTCAVSVSLSQEGFIDNTLTCALSVSQSREGFIDNTLTCALNVNQLREGFIAIVPENHKGSHFTLHFNRRDNCALFSFFNIFIHVVSLDSSFLTIILLLSYVSPGNENSRLCSVTCHFQSADSSINLGLPCSSEAASMTRRFNLLQFRSNILVRSFNFFTRTMVRFRHFHPEVIYPQRTLSEISTYLTFFLRKFKIKSQRKNRGGGGGY